MARRMLGPVGSRRRRRFSVFGPFVAFAAVAALLVFVVGAAAVVPAPNCSTLNVVTGSNFEIDVNANLKVDGSGNCIDWLNAGTANTLMSSVLKKNDKPTGSGDDSFGQGTAEDNPNPTIVDGSIPPNKSDLKAFAVNTETTTAGKFLQLFWSRVQNPSGTTNMDFELNQKQCDGTATNCAQNGTSKAPLFVTPKRTTGDKLITYDLSKGGTVPSISIRSWSGSAWGAATVISGSSATAIGAVNTTTIPANQANDLGQQDPFTFGEVSISYAAIFGSGGQCGTFGSAYLKSRSSDSFTAEIKDFVEPEPVFISNCAAITTSATASVVIGNPISDTATLSDIGAGAGGTITFRLYNSLANCNLGGTTVGQGGLLYANTVNVNGPGNYGSGNFTPTAVGTYFWIASYSGDANNTAASGTCGDTGESSVVGKQSPGISTSATASVIVGTPISDVATLSGGTSDIGGTITFRLYNSLANCNAGGTTVGQGGLVYANTVTVSGNGNYNSGNFTPTAVGTYFWIASYSGDAKNNSVSGACGDASESSVVGQAPSTIATSQSFIPNDSATIGGGGGGTVSFKLYGPNNATCDASGAAPVYSQTVNVSGGAAATTNTGTAVTAAGTYKWLVVYSGDASHEGRTSACGAEQFTLAVQNDSGPGTAS